jgi:hypothetical protein
MYLMTSIQEHTDDRDTAAGMAETPIEGTNQYFLNDIRHQSLIRRLKYSQIQEKSRIEPTIGVYNIFTG